MLIEHCWSSTCANGMAGDKKNVLRARTIFSHTHRAYLDVRHVRLNTSTQIPMLRRDMHQNTVATVLCRLIRGRRHIDNSAPVSHTTADFVCLLRAHSRANHRTHSVADWGALQSFARVQTIAPTQRNVAIRHTPTGKA